MKMRAMKLLRYKVDEDEHKETAERRIQRTKLNDEMRRRMRRYLRTPRRKLEDEVDKENDDSRNLEDEVDEEDGEKTQNKLMKTLTRN